MNPFTIEAIVGDLLELDVAVIVNPANPDLHPGGGVSGQIHAFGGPRLTEACKEIGRVATGQAVCTPSFDLPHEAVIHTVGPIFGNHNGAEADLLSSCYQRSMELATRHGLTSIGFPAISTGIYRYPYEMAAEIAVEAVLSHYRDNPKSSVRRVVFAVRIPGQDQLYREILRDKSNSYLPFEV